MTGKELLWSVASGGKPNRRPKIALFESLPESDARVAPWSAFDESHLRLVAVRSPYAKWRATGRRSGSPGRVGVEAATSLARCAAEVREEIRRAQADGADGIVYLLFGASPDWCTPMEYGGLVLESDRELLAEAKESGFTLLWVAGGRGTYLDCVTDLPHHVFAWDRERTQVGVCEMRNFAAGPLCATGNEADIELIGDLREGGEIPTVDEVPSRA